MKKIITFRALLIVMAAMIGCMANAQLLNSNKTGKVYSAVQRPAMMQVKKDAPVKEPIQMHNKMVKKKLNLGQQLTLSQNAQVSLNPNLSFQTQTSSRKAAALKSTYTAIGTNYSTKVKESWTLKSGTLSDGTTPCLIDVIPVPEKFAELESIAVPYTQNDNEIVIQPIVVTTLEEDGNTIYVLLFSAVDEKGCIRLTINEDGKLTTAKSDYYVYGSWEQPEYIYDDKENEFVGYLGYYAMYNGVQYFTEDEIPAPDARYEPAATYYHIGASSSGNGYVANYAVVPPYATIPFKNLTTDMADTWSWRMAQQTYNSETKDYSDAEVFTANTRDFSINTLPETYSPAELTASFRGESGETFTWGLPYEYNGSYKDAKIFGGELTSSMIFSDETEATLTRANTKDFGYYYSGSYLTPGKSTADYTISTLISYQSKPAAPLYITGVHLGVYKLEAKEDFNLKCKIQQMTFDEQGRVVLGDVLAESEITYDDLGNIEDGSFDWTEFYVEDEWGMTKSIDHLFVEDEFAVVIEGWDNGTFDCYSLIDGCEFGNVSNTYFKIAGDEEGTIYHYTNNYQHLDLGIYGGWGYLHTEDDTNLIFDKDGGTSTIHIDPMLHSKDEETEKPTYSLFIEKITDGEEELEEIPEWLDIEVANEDYTIDKDGNFVHGIDYDLVFTAAALPEGKTTRSVQIVFFQEGAKLNITINQENKSIITFADTNVKAICVSNWDTNGDGELSYEEAAAVTSLGSAFQSNTLITSFNELQYFTGLSSIGENAFRDCSALTSIIIPENVTSISPFTFSGCSSLTSITIPNSVTNIGNMAFSYCRSLKSVTIGNSVTSIGNSAFYCCSSLKSVSIPESVTSISNNAFSSCSSLTSITIPESVTSIGDAAFWGCSSLTSITISDGVTSIGNQAFQDCNRLNSIIIPNSATSIGNQAFYGCSSLTSVTIPNSVTSIGNQAFYGCSSLTSVTIPNNVTSIEWSAFWGCSSLASVTIPESVTSIGEYAFYDCRSLTSVTIGNNVTSIGEYAFTGCSGLTSITIGNSVTSIGNSAFWGCSSLTSVTIGNSVTSIGKWAFESCDKLSFVKMGKETPIEIENNTFSNCANAILQVPIGSKTAYEAANYWKDFKKIVDHIYNGDVNVDEQVNVVDVVDIARFVVGTPGNTFIEGLADINQDGSVNIGDAVTLVNDIAGDQNFVKAWNAPGCYTANDLLSLTEHGDCLLLNLDNERSYTAFQFDLYVPEDADVNKMMLDAARKQGHQLLYNKVGEGHYRVATLSTSNNAFNGNDGALLNIALTGADNSEVSIRNIHFFDAQGKDYLFEDIESAVATSINSPSHDSDLNGGEIYDLQGRKHEKMQKGVNIISGRKIMVK